MKTVVVLCAVLVALAGAPAVGAPLRTGWFDQFAPRPPRAIPHARRHDAAAAPLPRPKPQSEPGAAPPTASQPTAAAPPPSGPIVFPPVAPLE
jgi:hypothetical protein